MPLAPPTSQKADARPISFVLDDQTSQGEGISPKNTLSLWVRPEDLTRVDPSKLYTQQTLGPTARADSFGFGITSINISGHTGWRRSADNSEDGEARFKNLKDQVFDQWHLRRANALKAGRDPEGVRLIFADALDNFAFVVAPVSFTLRRSRARPLLLQYQKSMTVLDPNLGQATFLGGVNGRTKGPAELQLSGLDSLSASVDKITGFAKDIRNVLDRRLAAPVAAFMQQTARLYNSVSNAIRAGDGIAESLITTARLSSHAGLNIFRTAAAVAGIPALAKARLMQVAGAYTNVFCVLRNAVNQQLFYPDYSPLFGASNCSSTSGGRPPSPLSGVNPFYLVAPTPTVPPVQLSAIAQNSLQQLTAADVVLSPMPIPQLASTVALVVSGTQIS